MTQRMNRIQPQLGAGAFKTYQILAPAGTHFRPATCAEVGCQAHLNGWRVRVEGLPPQMVHTARTAGRRFTEQQVAAGETWLVFEAGQPCFKASEHRVRLEDRPELFLVRGGDWRGNPTGEHRTHRRAADWVDDFGEHQQRIADQIERG